MTLFQAPLLPLGKLENEENEEKCINNSSKIIDTFHVYKTEKKYNLFEKNTFLIILSFLNEKDKIHSENIHSEKIYSKGLKFMVVYNYDLNKSLTNACLYLNKHKPKNPDEYNVVKQLIKSGAFDQFYNNLIDSCRQNNYLLFKSLYLSLGFTFTDIKYLAECYTITKDKNIKDFIYMKLDMLDMTGIIN